MDNDKSISPLCEVDTSAEARSRSTDSGMTAVLDAESKSLTREREIVAAGVAVLDWLLIVEASAIRLISSSALIEVLDCEAFAVTSNR